MTSSDSPERFTRTVDLYGEDGFAALRAARVTVFGLGGVGAHAAVALARSGIGALTLVDFDKVTASSLNRSPAATEADLDRPKAEVLRDHLALTCPYTEVRSVRAFFHEDSADELLSPAPSLVADCIDSLNPKVALLAQCVRRGLAVASSMGAAGRTDVSMVRAGDLWDSRVCPLASRVRKFLRRQGIDAPVPAVWSEETPCKALPPDLDDQVLDRGRVRNRLPSGIALPGIFGYALASLILDRLASK
ncbi:tRNA threonylcarbamoyladenosine dehydratase [bacterium]|nr:tRNA threonylcarbamoyladenosine dehydratase [bacterium]